MAEQTIAEIVRSHADETPDKPAIVYLDRTTTFGQLEDHARRLANGLVAEGVGNQVRVAFLDKNTPEFFEAMLGAVKINAVLVPVSWRLAPAEATYIINDADARVLLVGEDLAEMLDEMSPLLTTVTKIVVVGCHGDHESYQDWISRQPNDDVTQQRSPRDLALQVYSSGTTGFPKGVMLSHDNCARSVATLELTLDPQRENIAIVAMPLFHVAGVLWGLFPLTFGMTSYLEREVDPARLTRLMNEEPISHAVLVPAVINFMLQQPEIDSCDFRSMRYIAYGSAPISEHVLRKAVQVFGCKFLQGYGLTETTGLVIGLPPEDHDPDGPNLHRLRSCGKPMSDAKVKVVDPATLEPVDAGVVGEILIQSAQNMQGYWRQPEATAATLLPDNWLRTGDAGYLDEEGYVYLHDRIKDLIISGGENIYPAEVENALMGHPAVADVAVVGVPSEKWGETPKAFVVRAPGRNVDEEELIEHCHQHIARFKCPTSVEWREDLPRTPGGKLLKRELRAPYWEGHDRKVH